MYSVGGRPCGNCGTKLSIPIWEDLLIVPIVFISAKLLDLNAWLSGLAVLAIALTFVYLCAVFMPFKVKSK